jgi:ABC-type nickel/cobalt efflux system permease component RcnA
VPTVRAIFFLFGVLFAMTAPVGAHPLGNFTSNHLTRLTIGANEIDVHYVLDDAEIPTFSLLRSLDANGRPSDAALRQWAQRYGGEISPQLTLRVNETPATLHLVRTGALLRPGAAGLTTLYFTADYRAARPAGAARIAYADTTLPKHIGWRDVVVAPAREPTDELRRYPSALVASPREQTSVAVTVDPDGAQHVAAGPPPSFDDGTSTGRMDELSSVLARNLSDPLVLIGALLLAIGLGALHALEPGHGKTLLAISLVGARATVPQAAILAAALTVAHTAGVLLFGVVVLTLARYIVPETLYPWIALLSGVFVAVLGARALANELARRSRRTPVRVTVPAALDAHALAAQRAFAAFVHDHPHDHAHPHDHDHGDLDDAAHARAHAIPGTAPLSFRSALIAAASGNVAPCPAALVVLLAAIATHRIGYGLVLIVAFSIGLALTLTVLGVAVVRSAAWLTKRPAFDRFAQYAPLVTACAISIIGAAMIGEAAVAQGISFPPAAIAALVLAVIAAATIVRTTRRDLPQKAIA